MSEFNEFKPRQIPKKTILTERRGLNLTRGSNSLNSALDFFNVQGLFLEIVPLQNKKLVSKDDKNFTVFLVLTVKVLIEMCRTKTKYLKM